MLTRCLHSFLACCIVAAASSAFAQSEPPADPAALEREFLNPPAATQPRCYWYWMKGHISKEGITRDLEAMKRVGIGEAYIGVIEGGGEIKALTEEWWDLLAHAVREGTRLDVDTGLFNCPGWSQSGGPWVKPEQSMRYLVLPETRVTGPRRFEGKLPAPEGFFQDVAVMAFPAPAMEADTAAARGATLTREAQTMTFEFAEPFTARSLTIRPKDVINVGCELQTSDDGREFKTVTTFTVDRHNLATTVGPVPLAPIIESFAPVTARWFRVQCAAPADLGDVELSAAPRVTRALEKQLAKMFQDPVPPFDFYMWPPAGELDAAAAPSIIRPESVRDLSKQLAADGTLRWDVPEGDWIIVRAGMAPTGVTNAPAAPEATGLEVDKMNREPLAAHFDAYIGELLRRVPEAERASLKHIVADSYETGSQNWTDGFAEIFRRRYGYDPLPSLPALTGRVVGGADASDRFLWDLRRLIADRVATEYVGGLRALCNRHGLRMWLENYGHWGFPAEFLQYGGQTDEVGGEFWANGSLGNVELRAAASAAHTYGRRQVFAEAFTGGPAFENTPRELKARGDWALCEGINQFVLHVVIHQPWEDRRPGVNAWFGTEFNRHNTWFEYARPWTDYLRRATVMLQAGRPVADVAYFIGEDTPKMSGARSPELPAGYDYDFINAEVIEQRLEVKDGRFVLPEAGGTCAGYRLLILPPEETMRPEVLKKIRALVEAGGAILGAAPTRSPSLEDYPACDDRVRKLAGELWGETSDAGGPASPVIDRRVGRGRVFAGIELAEALRRLETPPDVIAPEGILWKHRRLGEAGAGEAGAPTDIYFVSNQRDQARAVELTFRVEGRAPDLWWPESGRIERTAVYEVAPGVVRLPLTLGPTSSVFVVFREQGREDERIARVTRDAAVVPLAAIAASDLTTAPLVLTRARRKGAAIAGFIEAYARAAGRFEWSTAAGSSGALDRTAAGLVASMAVAGPWQVRFDPQQGGPAAPVEFAALSDWTMHADPAIRYYSGAAVYRATFQFDNSPAGLALDLGEVRSIARVRVNGRELGTLWKPPYVVALGDAARTGENTLEIEVVNAWRNRLIGDAQPGVAQPLTSALEITWKADSPLLPAGLIGPVLIRQE